MRTAANRTIIAAVRNHNVCFKDKYLTTEDIAINPKIGGSIKPTIIILIF